MTLIYTVLGIAYVILLLAINAKKLNAMNEKYILSRAKK